jgi:hypothetical protein
MNGGINVQWEGWPSERKVADHNSPIITASVMKTVP